MFVSALYLNYISHNCDFNVEIICSNAMLTVPIKGVEAYIVNQIHKEKYLRTY